MRSKTKIAVVGAGNMGINHVRAYMSHDDVDLVGIVDIDKHRAASVAAEFNIPMLNLDDVPQNADAVSIVVPSSLHLDVGVYLLSHNIHCLIEKPLALSSKDGHELVRCAQTHNARLLVGHVEEYNQGFYTLKHILNQKGERPRSIVCQRFNYGSSRIQDADVILDLMIHDLGCSIDLLGGDRNQLRVLSAHGLCRAEMFPPKSLVDMATATLATDTCMISLQASRMSHQRHREFVVQTDDHTYVLDFVSQHVQTFSENRLIAQTDEEWASPLEREIQHFVACVRNPDLDPITSGEKACLSLMYVQDIQDLIYGTKDNRSSL